MGLYADHKMLIFTAALLLPLALCVVHGLLIGRRDPELGRLPATVPRLSVWDRVVHGVRVLTFVLAAVTGYLYLFDATPVGHLQSGMLLALASVLSLVPWYRQSLLRSEDLEWLAHLGGYLSTTTTQFRPGMFNAGQKLFIWISLGAVVALAVTGIVLKTEGASGSDALRATHGLLAAVMIALVIFHAYLSVWAVPGTWRAMITGRVAKEWMARHHPGVEETSPETDDLG